MTHCCINTSFQPSQFTRKNPWLNKTWQWLNINLYDTSLRYVLFWNTRRSLMWHINCNPSDGDCLEVKREYYQNCSVLDCVTQCSQSAAHLCEQFLQSNRLGLSHSNPYAVHGGGCLELYYCNMVEWFWWDSNLILTTSWFPSVLWHCWFGHLACKNRPWNDLWCVEWDVKPLH